MLPHQASYRVYRPRRFSEVQGQERTIETLRQAVRQGRLTHAYLFSGPRGTGKTSVARILAKAINCEKPDSNGDPCLNCVSCRSVEMGQHLDVIEIDAASNRGIDEIREIKERITHQTAMSAYKVYIIDEVHMLTADAFNALLKTLEEPPNHVIFILATTEAHKLPITVLSRCQRYEFHRLTVPIIKERLRYVAEQEGVAWDESALELLAEAADGALRDALSLFDQVVATQGTINEDAVTRVAGLAGHQAMMDLAEGLTQGIEPLVAVLARLREEGLDEKLILRDFARQLRDLLLFRTAGPGAFPAYRQDALAHVNALFPEDIAVNWWIESADQVAQAEARLKGGFPADLAVELCFLKMQQRLWNRQAPQTVTTAERQVPTAPKERVVLAPPDDAKPANSFEAVLDIVKRERPSTYALFEKASGEVSGDGSLVIHFEFPAHKELVNQPHNREVVDRAIKTVFGPEIRYHFAVGPSQEEPLARENASGTGELAVKVRQWFGPDVKMIGFPQSTEKG